jgi:hypothetical protein
MMKVVSEDEFAVAIRRFLESGSLLAQVGAVTGPGRSGAIAAVYASHILRVPFIPYGSPWTEGRGRILVIDTAMESGATLRKAERRYKIYQPIVCAVYQEPPRVAFWYEAAKPQRYRHERAA